ncbi:CpXC domain-containing protein [Aggregatilinea lenta]|uniref:CpXC domain-containing protein n=1 Tax=Aggregatilinea lenta TaxID=913108 RepID=UPI000E5ABFE1|nr:CpXC domain-containing protein [Aggregatilinea lenta]
MSQVVRTSLTCPRCGQPFTGVVEQIIDIDSDPQAKNRFLSGQVNQVQCPNCGFTMAVGTPLVYHDSAREMFITYMPMELNIPPQERERVIGDLSRRLMDSIPPEKRKGYLFQPKQALTLPGMIDMILDAEGITQDMRDAQREKMRVMEMFLQVGEDQWPRLIEENADMIDLEFFQMTLVTAENAAQSGKDAMAEALILLYNFLVQNTEIGQEAMQQAQVQEEVIREVAEDVQRLGENLSREAFMDLVLSYAGDTDRVQALVGLMRPAFDYNFFQELSAKMAAAEGEERELLEDLRQDLLEMTTALDQQTQAVLQRAAETLRFIVNAEDIDAAIRPRMDQIDDTFLAVLQANISNAEEHQDLQTSARLKQVLEKVLEILRDAAPPQIRFINELMTAPTEEEARAVIEAQAGQYGPELLELMEAVAQDLDESERTEEAAVLRGYRAMVASYVSAGA